MKKILLLVLLVFSLSSCCINIDVGDKYDYCTCYAWGNDKPFEGHEKHIATVVGINGYFVKFYLDDDVENIQEEHIRDFNQSIKEKINKN